MAKDNTIDEKRNKNRNIFKYIDSEMRYLK